MIFIGEENRPCKADDHLGGTGGDKRLTEQLINTSVTPPLESNHTNDI